MGNTSTSSYILDDFQNKHTIIKKEFNIYQNQSFIYFKPKKKFNSKDIEIFITKISDNKKDIIYILNANISLENPNYMKNSYFKYYKGSHIYEVNESCNDYKISIKMNLKMEIFLIVIKLDSKNLHKIS